MSKAIHLGHGIILFKGAADIDENELHAYLGDLEAKTTPQDYRKEEATGRLVSDGGYEYDSDSIAKAPLRYTNTVFESISEEGVRLIQGLEDVFYSCLVTYCRNFPVAINDIKWRTRGYVIRYENGQGIGPHSDTSIPYTGDGLDSETIHPALNTLTGGIFLNQDYAGGTILFRPWGIRVNPEKGDALIYPSSFIGCHEVQPVTEGVRYAYLTWFGHGQTNMIQPPNSTDQGLHMIVKRVHDLRKDVGDEFSYQKDILVGELRNK